MFIAIVGIVGIAELSEIDKIETFDKRFLNVTKAVQILQNNICKVKKGILARSPLKMRGLINVMLLSAMVYNDKIINQIY